jgi:hypothetical protein
MATAANRRIPEGLKIAFDYDTEPAIGDMVELTGSRHVQALTLAGRHKCVGEVIGVRSALSECTVATKFQRNLITRIAGETVTAGPFVFGVDSKVYQYSPGSVAVVTGSTTGAKTYVLNTSDKVKINYNNEGSQTFTITAGVGVTMATVATEVNATAVGFTCSVDADGHFVLTGDEIGKPLEIEAVSNDAYTLLGLTAAVTRCAGPSHDASLIAGLVVVGGAAAAAVETLEY